MSATTLARGFDDRLSAVLAKLVQLQTQRPDKDDAVGIDDATIERAAEALGLAKAIMIAEAPDGSEIPTPAADLSLESNRRPHPTRQVRLTEVQQPWSLGVIRADMNLIRDLQREYESTAPGLRKNSLMQRLKLLQSSVDRQLRIVADKSAEPAPWRPSGPLVEGAGNRFADLLR